MYHILCSVGLEFTVLTLLNLLREKSFIYKRQFLQVHFVRFGRKKVNATLPCIGIAQRKIDKALALFFASAKLGGFFN